jgi:hypothetical protein
VSAPTRASIAGRAYLDLRKLARENQRPVDELLQLYVLEAFLSRLTSSGFAEQLVLKGGVLLAAFDERRPTRDIDLQAQAVENDAQTILATTCEIAAMRSTTVSSSTSRPRPQNRYETRRFTAAFE